MCIRDRSSAFIHKALSRGKRTLSVNAWEIDPVLQQVLHAALEHHTTRHSNLDASVNTQDFIEECSYYASAGINEPYTHAILNPPYKKLATSSDHRKFLRTAGVETVNLYAGFTALAIKLLGHKFNFEYEQVTNNGTTPIRFLTGRCVL